MPAVKAAVTKSSKLRTKHNMLAAAIEGHRSGSTTSRSAPIGVAPRSRALCSISGLMLASRLRTTTVTNGMQNPIIASSIV